ncbi:hypothetical protein LIA77_00046 [Sarocladium implicatum]|nr:hypothetical protein LIA77_00046 [Sarocladium implicatum]
MVKVSGVWSWWCDGSPCVDRQAQVARSHLETKEATNHVGSLGAELGTCSGLDSGSYISPNTTRLLSIVVSCVLKHRARRPPTAEAIISAALLRRVHALCLLLPSTLSPNAPSLLGSTSDASPDLERSPVKPHNRVWSGCHPLISQTPKNSSCARDHILQPPSLDRPCLRPRRVLRSSRRSRRNESTQPMHDILFQSHRYLRTGFTRMPVSAWTRGIVSVSLPSSLSSQREECGPQCHDLVVPFSRYSLVIRMKLMQ